MNGWKNWETWNASLWLANDEHLYNTMINYLTQASGPVNYDTFLKATNLNRVQVDGMFFDNAAVDRGEMNKFLQSFHLTQLGE